MSSKVRAIMMLIALVGLTATCIYWYINDKEEPNKTLQEPPECKKEEIWIPTEEDIAYQDSMYQIIQNTQHDVDTIKVHIEYILDRLEYPDGTYDSVRYEVRNKENQSR